jgi:hypothetical protein
MLGKFRPSHAADAANLSVVFFASARTETLYLLTSKRFETSDFAASARSTLGPRRA